MIRLLALFALLPAAVAQAAPAPLPRVKIDTSLGSFMVALNARAAPITSANFLAYVAAKRFDGTTFYRAARNRLSPKHGFIQGGIRHRYSLMLNPIAHEPTSRTGLTHKDGTISMARGEQPGTAMGDWFVTVGPIPSMDARPGYPGYAAFGQVVAGMATIHRILAVPIVPNAGIGPMRNQMIAKPVIIISARRVG